jgi:hypothetical protein
MKYIVYIIICIGTLFPAQGQNKQQQVPAELMGHRFLTFNTVGYHRQYGDDVTMEGLDPDAKYELSANGQSIAISVNKDGKAGCSYTRDARFRLLMPSKPKY